MWKRMHFTGSLFILYWLAFTAGKSRKYNGTPTQAWKGRGVHIIEAWKSSDSPTGYAGCIQMARPLHFPRPEGANQSFPSRDGSRIVYQQHNVVLTMEAFKEFEERERKKQERAKQNGAGP